jgi:hypothetical protein
MIKTAAPTREDVTDVLDASLREIAFGDVGDAKAVQIAAQHMLADFERVQHRLHNE